MIAAADFKAERQEFRTATDDLVNLKIAEAARRVAPDVYGEKTDDALSLLAAHLLAISPFGRSQRLANADGTSIYLTEFQAIRQEVAPRIIVI